MNLGDSTLRAVAALDQMNLLTSVFGVRTVVIAAISTFVDLLLRSVANELGPHHHPISAFNNSNYRLILPI